MKPFLNTHKALVTTIGGGVILATVLLIVFLYIGNKTGIVDTSAPTVVTDEKIPLPAAIAISGSEGKFTEKTAAHDVPLVPKRNSDEIIVSGAELTGKESYATAKEKAMLWAPDAKLVFIQSLGTVMLDGKSSIWQIGFGSKAKKKGYEVVIQGSSVASEKEVSSSAYGFDLPKNWYDVKDAIDSVRTLPQFDAATLSQVNFFYDTDAQEWRYSIVSSIGASVIRVR